MMRKMVICVALLMLVALTGVGAAQSGELLRNPGFEQPYLAGPEGVVADGWSSWFLGTSAERPDYLDPTVAPVRAISGDAQGYSSFLAAHNAGLYQSVAGLTPGAMLTFSANVWVWSTQDDMNPDVSVNPGLVMVSVGIDTTGSVNPEGATIIWSEPVEAYDAFTKVSVSAAPTDSVATVFIKTTVGEARLVTEVYVDDASLLAAEVAATTPDAPTEEAVPTEEVAVEPTTEPAEPTPEDTAATEEAAAEPTESPFLSTIQYVVQPGDSYDLIARVYGSTVAAIKEANGVAFEDNLIYPGDVLTIPVPVLAVDPNAPTVDAPTEAAPLPTSEPTAEPTAEPTMEPTPEPTAAPTEEVVIVETAEVVLETTYTVQRGDTLMEIANRYETDVFELGRLNNILNYNMIRVGQVLELPAQEPEVDPATPEPTTTPEPVVHFVQFGDSVYRIAARYGVTAQAIIEANGIENPNRIYYGQRLIIPQ